MDRQPLRPKRYGNITVGGRAKVQLGDSQITQNYHVGAVSLTVPEEFLQLLRNAAATVNAKGQRARYSKKSVQQIAARKRSTEIGSSKNGTLAERAQHCARTTYNEAEINEVEHGQPDPEHMLVFVQKLLLKVWRLPFTGQSANSLSQEDALTVHRSAELDEHESQTRLKTYFERAAVVRDRLMVGAFLLFWIIGKNVPADIVKFPINCRQDDLVLLLLFTSYIGAYHYYTMRTICREPTHQFWILEDAYGFSRQISMDVLIDYSVFQTFLMVHYRDTERKTGVTLIEADQLHLMLGSRRGVVIGRVNWKAAVNKIKPGRRVINAVYITTYNRSCFTCKSDLIVTEYGEFHCMTCNIFYRDYDTFDLQAQQSTRRESNPSPSTEPKPATQSVQENQHPPQETQEYGQKPVQGVVEEKYNTDGIKNLDIRLMPRPEASTLWNQDRWEEAYHQHPNNLRKPVVQICTSPGLWSWESENPMFDYIGFVAMDDEQYISYEKPRGMLRATVLCMERGNLKPSTAPRRPRAGHWQATDR